MGKHTPGPWQVRHEVVIYSSDGLTVIGSAGTGNCHREDETANAQLIASAPDLLEALGLCLVQLEKEHMPSDEVMHAMHHARAAICKAVQSPRGEA